MFNSTALDVVIGLVFIYLLYSLLATVISEIIASQLGLRARNLKEAIDRMLNDEKEMHFWKRLWDSLRLMKNPKNGIIDNFYSHPEIKYLGSSGIFKTPSSFKAISFSKTLINVLFGDGLVDKEKIEIKLKEIIENEKDENKKILDPDTAKYIQSLWDDSDRDVLKFKLQLEGWFDRTMIEATEWYKRKMRIVTFLVGFCIAWFFGADTISIVKILSTDSVAREQIVKMTDAYVTNSKNVNLNPAKDSLRINYSQKLDSLLDIEKDLYAHISNAHSVLGMGAWLPDSIEVIYKNNGKIYKPEIESSFHLSNDNIKINKAILGIGTWLPDSLEVIYKNNRKIYKPVIEASFHLSNDSTMVNKDSIKVNNKKSVKVSSLNIVTFNNKGNVNVSNNGNNKSTVISTTIWDKFGYLFFFLYHHFWGILITAIAISLGAPFWFDLLNKVMRLRTSSKEVPDTSSNSTPNNPPITINLKNQTGEAAVK